MKRVFDSNVSTCELVLPHEVEDSTQRKNEEALIKSIQTKSSSEDNNSLVTLSRSFPPNQRYQNCRDSDDEDEDLYYGSSDLNDEDDDSDLEESEKQNNELQDNIEEHGRESLIVIFGLNDEQLSSIGSKPNVRERNLYAYPVMNPVENLIQWRTAKSKRNMTGSIVSNPESRFSRISLCRELSTKSKHDRFENLNQEIIVDANFSSWLGTSEITRL